MVRPNLIGNMVADWKSQDRGGQREGVAAEQKDGQNLAVRAAVQAPPSWEKWFWGHNDMIDVADDTASGVIAETQADAPALSRNY